MEIKTLKLTNIRSYSNAQFYFEKGLNVLYGENAQGKTNVLEAIFFSVIGRSFRTSKEKELVKWGCDFGKIETVFDNGYREIKIEIILKREGRKTILVDGIALRRVGELLGRTCAVFFSPNELKLVKESPEDRRKFLNIAISQTNKKYFYLLGRYEKVLANRNKLLKNSSNLKVVEETIDIWNRALSQISEEIFYERKKFIEEILPFAEKAHKYLSNGRESLKIFYKSDFSENYKENMLKSLQKNLEKDFKLGYTSIGIHKDDLIFLVNEKDVKIFGSQGQQRTVALSLKLAELECNKNRNGSYPILLLDDVFSELDEDRKNRLLNFTQKTQTIITTTEMVRENNAKYFLIKRQK